MAIHKVYENGHSIILSDKEYNERKKKKRRNGCLITILLIIFMIIAAITDEDSEKIESEHQIEEKQELPIK